MLKFLVDLRAVLADPFCRYEAWRYWTWRRYTWLSLALVAWSVLIWASLRSGANAFSGPEEMVLLLVIFSLFGRAPLSFEASTGSALCIVPERVSGQLEQFILTPLDSWRFCLARLAGRLRGLGIIWLAFGAVLAYACLLAWVGPGLEDPGLVLLLVLVLQVDLAAMLVVDAAVGMRFTATSASTPAALIKTYLTNFLLTPLAMYMGPAVVFGVAIVMVSRIAQRNPEDLGGIWLYLPIVCGFTTRLVLGTLAVWIALRDARKAIEKVFYEPGE